MTTLTIFGDVSASRAWWTAWACRELDLEFENVRFGFLDEEIKRDDYLALNPNGLIPTIRDGEFVLWESLAINLYLAKKHGGALYPDTLEGEALVWQWSFWAVTRVEVPLLTLMVASMDDPAGSDLERYFLKHVPVWTGDEVGRCRAVLQAPFKVLNDWVRERPYLLGAAFTIADLNVSAVLSRNSGAKINLSAMPYLADWLERCWSRPACPRREMLLQVLDAVR